jgi:hypothetical protein
MREREFLPLLRDKFDLLNHVDVARDLAVALGMAQRDGGVLFAHDNVVYEITAAWYDGCIAGDCNPATCYMSWSIDIISDYC